MDNSSTSLPNQLGSASSLPDSQIFNQLYQLYNVLQSYYPDWCRENPILSIVRKCSDAELGDLAVSWEQFIDGHEAQLRAAAPVV